MWIMICTASTMDRVLISSRRVKDHRLLRLLEWRACYSCTGTSLKSWVCRLGASNMRFMTVMLVQNREYFSGGSVFAVIRGQLFSDYSVSSSSHKDSSALIANMFYPGLSGFPRQWSCPTSWTRLATNRLSPGLPFGEAGQRPTNMWRSSFES